MQQLGLKSPVRLKKYRSYRGNMGLAAENILQRQFKAEAPCEKWVTDTEAQHSAAVDAAEAQRQSLIDAAMASISLIQLKLQAGRKLTQAETTRLNAVLDYIDAVTVTDTSTAPDVIWPELPEA